MPPPTGVRITRLGGVLAAGAVAVLGELGDDLVVGGEDEVAELDLGDGDEAVEGHADRRADDTAFGEGRVDDAVVAELVEEALGDAEDAADLADVLAEDDDAGVAAHLETERVVDGLDHVHLRHVESLCGAVAAAGLWGSWAECAQRAPGRGAFSRASRCSTRCHGGVA